LKSKPNKKRKEKKQQPPNNKNKKNNQTTHWNNGKNKQTNKNNTNNDDNDNNPTKNEANRIQTKCLLLAFWFQSLSDRGSSSRQVSRPSSLGSSISDIRDENVGTPATTPTTPITAHPVAAAAAALASGAMNANGEIDYKKLWEESQVENERLRDRLRTTHEDLTKCKDQLDNAFQVSNARNAMTEAEKRERRALERKLSEMEEELKESNKIAELLRSDISKMRDENGALIRVISKLSK